LCQIPGFHRGGECIEAQHLFFPDTQVHALV